MKEEEKKVIFETDEWAAKPNRYIAEPLPYMVRLVIRYSGGLIKEEGQAVKVLLGLSIFIIIISILLFITGSSSHKPQSGEIPFNQSLPN